jgi:hypothetical protein
MRFQTKITRARFVVGPFTADNMVTIAQAVRDSIAARLKLGLNAEDAPAKPLKPRKGGGRGYPEYKIARGLQPIRDWWWSGRTVRSMKVLRASENMAVIGFTDARSDRVAHINNLTERAFGMSPKNRVVLYDTVRAVLRRSKFVSAQRVA